MTPRAGAEDRARRKSIAVEKQYRSSRSDSKRFQKGSLTGSLAAPAAKILPALRLLRIDLFKRIRVAKISLFGFVDH